MEIQNYTSPAVLRITSGEEYNDSYITTKSFPAKCRRTIEEGGAVYGVLTRDDKEQLDRIERMLKELILIGNGR